MRACVRPICCREAVQQHPAVLNLRASIASQLGDFAQAAELARRAIALEPQWASVLAGTCADSQVRARRCRPGAHGSSGAADAAHAGRLPRAPFFYALGKARHDCGEYDQAFAAYGEGAAKMRAPFEAAAEEQFAHDVIRDFTRENLARLTPSGCDSDRAIFVIGLPRSGTTLVEQILASHSAVAGGEEVNLFHTALIPAGDFSLQGGLDYQARTAGADPWGEIGAGLPGDARPAFRSQGAHCRQDAQSFALPGFHPAIVAQREGDLAAERSGRHGDLLLPELFRHPHRPVVLVARRYRLAFPAGRRAPCALDHPVSGPHPHRSV